MDPELSRASATVSPEVEARAARERERRQIALDNLRGVGWMALASVIFVGFTIIVRIVSTDMHPAQTAFLRYAFGLVLMLPVLGRAILGGGLRLSGVRLHGLRGLVHGIGVLLWFVAIARIPLAEVTSLSFLAPVLTTVGAFLFLGETIRLRRIMAVLAGFLGAMIVLRPGVAVIDIGAVAMLISAPLFAMSTVLAKVVTRTDSAATTVAWLSLIVTLTLLIPALYVWRTPTWEELAWLALIAGLATVGHLCMTQAFKVAELTAIQPVNFLQLVWASLAGYYVFAEEPVIWVWIGGAVIVASATYIAHREALARRREID